MLDQNEKSLGEVEGKTQRKLCTPVHTWGPCPRCLGATSTHIQRISTYTWGGGHTAFLTHLILPYKVLFEALILIGGAKKLSNMKNKNTGN